MNVLTIIGATIFSLVVLFDVLALTCDWWNCSAEGIIKITNETDSGNRTNDLEVVCNPNMTKTLLNTTRLDLVAKFPSLDIYEEHRGGNTKSEIAGYLFLFSLGLSCACLGISTFAVQLETTMDTCIRCVAGCTILAFILRIAGLCSYNVGFANGMMTPGFGAIAGILALVLHIVGSGVDIIGLLQADADEKLAKGVSMASVHGEECDEPGFSRETEI